MELIWFKDYNILFNDERYLDFFPTPNMTSTQKLNAIVRMSIYMGIALSVITNNYSYLYITIVIMAITYFIFTNEKTKEHFVEYKPVCTKPESDNPFMNINLITDARDKPAACEATPEIKNQIEEKFNEKLYRDVGDLYGKNNSQREFHTMPSTTIPNNQTSFAKWCYKQSSTCKEDAVKCAPNWDVE